MQIDTHTHENTQTINVHYFLEWCSLTFFSFVHSKLVYTICEMLFVTYQVEFWPTNGSLSSVQKQMSSRQDSLWVSRMQTFSQGFGWSAHVAEGSVLAWRVRRTSLWGAFKWSRQDEAAGGGGSPAVDAVCTLSPDMGSWEHALQRGREGGKTEKGIHWWKGIILRFSAG